MKIENKKLISKLLQIPSTNVYLFENLKNYTSFKLNNQSCFCLLECNTQQSLLKALQLLKFNSAFSLSSLTAKKVCKHKIFVLGKGSNVIFDGFFNGFVIKLGRNFKNIKIVNKDSSYITIQVGAGVNLFILHNFLKNQGIGGLEWSLGIPASVGGAVFMNAGAFGNEFSNFVAEVQVLKNGKFVWINNFEFSYRTSSFQKSGSIITAVRLKLSLKSTNEVAALQQEYFLKRKNSQPYLEPSAGSVFKRIIKPQEIIYPAKLIDKLSLKGVKIKGAKVSTKHSGFIVNSGGASSEDVIQLIDLIKQKVSTAYNITLEPEIKIIK